MIKDLEKSTAQKMKELASLQADKASLASELAKLSQGKEKVEQEAAVRRQSVNLLEAQLSQLSENHTFKLTTL